MQYARGFSLIEVLIAVLIFAIGLLGVASLQLFGMQQTFNSNTRTQAVMLSQDMAERMRANRAGWLGGAYDSVDTSATNPTTNCLTSACSAADLANHDVREWAEAIEAELPGGRGGVEPDSDVMRISVTWRERREEADSTYILQVRRP